MNSKENGRNVTGSQLSLGITHPKVKIQVDKGRKYPKKTMSKKCFLSVFFFFQAAFSSHHSRFCSLLALACIAQLSTSEKQRMIISSVPHELKSN